MLLLLNPIFQYNKAEFIITNLSPSHQEKVFSSTPHYLVLEVAIPFFPEVTACPFLILYERHPFGCQNHYIYNFRFCSLLSFPINEIVTLHFSCNPNNQRRHKLHDYCLSAILCVRIIYIVDNHLFEVRYKFLYFYNLDGCVRWY